MQAKNYDGVNADTSAKKDNKRKVSSIFTLLAKIKERVALKSQI